MSIQGVDFGFIGPSYNHPFLRLDCQRCVNYYLETSEDGNSESKKWLIPVPGKQVKWDITPPFGVYTRRMYVLRGFERLFAVVGNGFYELFVNGTYTLYGSLLTTDGMVQMADNGFRIMLVDGARSYFFDLTSNTFSIIAAAGIPISSTVTYQDSYFLFNEINTTRIYQWNPDNILFPAFDPLAFGLSDTTSEFINGLIANLQNVFVFGPKSYEVWYDAALTPFSYTRMSNTTFEIGCVAPDSLALGLNTIYFVGGSQNGYGSIYRTDGSAPVRISTTPIEYFLNKLSTIRDASGYVYHEAGHDFYIVSFPTGNKTFGYDLKEGVWHERASWDTSRGIENRDRAQGHAFFNNQNFVGDWQNGKIYLASLNINDDAGAPLWRRRVAPHLHSQQNRVAYSRISFDMLFGYGLNIGQGSNPVAMLRFSDDAGYTWSDEIWFEFGKMGEYYRAANIWRLGMSRNRVFELTITDPIPSPLIGAWVTAEEISE